MNRRTFLKTIGLAIAAPGAVLGAVKAIPHQGSLFGTKVIEANKRFWQQEMMLDPLVIGGNKYYVMFIHPRQHYLLKVATARDKYKHERWLIRHNRWLEKQGKPPHKETSGEIGVFEDPGIKIVEYQRLPTSDEICPRCLHWKECKGESMIFGDCASGGPYREVSDPFEAK